MEKFPIGIVFDNLLKKTEPFESVWTVSSNSKF